LLTHLRTPQYRVTVLQAVLFDLDGTLLDTLADIARTMNIVFSEHGLPEHPVESYRNMVGSGLIVLIRRALGLVDTERSELESVMAARVRELFREDPIGSTLPYPGIESLLDGLSGRGIPMAVLSNKPHELTTRIIDGLLGSDRFVSVIGLRDESPAKPDPTSALESAGRLGVEPGKVVFLGDSDIDMKTAVNAGMYPVGVSWGFRPVDELMRAGARQIVTRPEQVGELLGVAMEV
jgi:phosphoglycolate phosphatase